MITSKIYVIFVGKKSEQILQLTVTINVDSRTVQADKIIYIDLNRTTVLTNKTEKLAQYLWEHRDCSLL